jgi:hypothetical protein
LALARVQPVAFDGTSEPLTITLPSERERPVWRFYRRSSPSALV